MRHRNDEHHKRHSQRPQCTPPGLKETVKSDRLKAIRNRSGNGRRLRCQGHEGSQPGDFDYAHPRVANSQVDDGHRVTIVPLGYR